MSPAAKPAAKLDIVLLANAEGQVRTVSPQPEEETKKTPARRRSPRTSKASAKDLSAAADELLAAADPKKKAAAAKKTTAKKATTTKAKAKTSKAKTTTTKAASTKTKAASKTKAAAKPAETKPTAEEQAKAAAAEKDAKAKALASIKIGPKGVYTEDSIRVYLQEIGRIRLLRPDEERSNWPAKLPIFSISRNWPLNLKATTAGNPTTKSGRPWWKCRSSASAGA